MNKFWKECDRYFGGYYDDSIVDLLARIVVLLTLASLAFITIFFILLVIVFIFTVLPIIVIVPVICIIIGASFYKAITRIIAKEKEGCN